ncbi:hypothetical protein KEJ21_03625 [Candidatus Bathyarchaeota archaeon]|nr:hypothetical protein [Candidatus Bathyarchaeota archaeon]MBS7630422.1 hypothetical protein [Candidatus Bathyarchaeota archaeon]
MEKAKNYSDIFSLVKKAVKKSLKEHRVGLMLYLGNLPMRVGAFHPIGTNDVVLNRRLINALKSEVKQKSYLFSILLHEYLHSLGYHDEEQVRALTYKISVENFGSQHPVVEASIAGPWCELTQEDYEAIEQDIDLEMIKDFEKIEIGYII